MQNPGLFNANQHHVQEREDRQELPIYTVRQQESNFQLLETSLQQILDLQGDPQYIHRLKEVTRRSHQQATRGVGMQLIPIANLIYRYVFWLLRLPRDITPGVWHKLRLPCIQLLRIMQLRGRIRRSKRAKSPRMDRDLKQHIQKYRVALCQSPRMYGIHTRIQILSRYVLLLTKCLQDEE